MTDWRNTALSFAAVPEVRHLLAGGQPAWIWSRDGSQILWANPAGGARLGAARLEELAGRRWSPGEPLRRELQGLAPILSDAERLARLRISRSIPALPTPCRCRNIRSSEGLRGILVVSLEDSARPALDHRDSFFPDGEPASPIAATPPAPANVTLAEAGERESTVTVVPEAPLGGSAEDPAPLGESVAEPPVMEAAEPGEAPPTEPSAAAAPPVEPSQPAPAPEAGSADAPVERSASAVLFPRELSRKPVRFLWQTDAAGRFLFVSPGLAQVVGRNAEIVGERWADLASRLRLDPPDRIGKALGQRDTWSGQTAWWPVEGSGIRVPVEMTALPVFGGDRSFQGYRGFGVLRPAEALTPAAFDLRFGAAGQPGRNPPERSQRAGDIAAAPANVIPIRADLERITAPARLSPQERTAFAEIASSLRQRISESLAGEAGRAAQQPEPSQHAVSEDQIVAPAGASEPKGPEPVSSSSSAEQPATEPVDPPVEPSAAAPVAATEPPAAIERTSPGAEGASSGDETPGGEPPPPRRPPAELDPERRLAEMSAILDTATDGILILDDAGTVESANASAQALFGLGAPELHGMPFVDLLTEESRASALDYLGGLKGNGVASLLNEGREVEAKAGSLRMPLFVTLGRISGANGERYCALLRDITYWKRAEAELVAARQRAEAASSHKSDFLARVSHEIRTPLNAIIGFAEVMIEERFGSIGNERYRDYLRDIRASGEHVVSLVNDLLDIAKIEAGKLDLTFTAVPLNDIVRECITLMQPQASRARVVLRSSLSREVPGIVADQRTMRQIVLNLLSNSVKYTGPGGQVIASTSLANTGEAILRVRDTGEGMSEDDLARALEPFRQLATSAISGRHGTGLGLPLTKALVEANRASFDIRSKRGEGTVVKVTFPPTRVLSE